MHYMHYMHYKDYIHHDFYVYSPVLLTQYLGHCWHTPCTELYILRISAWLLRKPPSPATGGGGTIWLGEGGCGGPCSYIYIYMQYRLNVKLKCFLLCHLWQVLFAPSWGYESLESLYEERWEGPKHAHPKSCWWHTATQTDRTTVPQDAKDEENAADGMEKLQKQMLWWHGYEWIHSLVIVFGKFGGFDLAKLRSAHESLNPLMARAQDQYDRKAAWASECLRFSECQCCQCLLLLVLLVLFNQLLVFFGFRHCFLPFSTAKRGSAVWIASSPRW